jgi:hypothetical protein
MSKTDFQIAFGGPALRAHTMDAGDLAYSLLAISDLLRDTNKQLNGDRAEVSVRVRADFKGASFDVALLLEQGLLEHAKNLLLAGAPVLGGAAMLRLLFGTEAAKKGIAGVITSALDIWKQLKGEKPKGVIEDKAKGLTVVVYGEGNTVTVNSDVGTLYASDTIRSSITNMVRPLSKEGIDRLEISKGDKTINLVSKSDLPEVPSGTIAIGETNSASILRDSREAMVKIVRANFEKGKWGFSDGTANFSADITDDGFKERLDAREVGFYKGDTLRVILTTTQVISEGSTFQTKYEIEKVIDHIHAPKQQKLIE